MSSKRQHERRDCDQCVSVIDSKTYPVKNWSVGGMQIFADSKGFAVHSEVDVTIKFKLRGDILDIKHKAKVVRKSYDRVALQFLPVTRQMQRVFQAVVDDFVANEFADSQLV